MRTAASAAMLLIMTSCLFENDMSYPEVLPEVISFEVEGQKRAAVIDAANSTIAVELMETADIKHVKLRGMNLSEHTVCEGIPADSLLDLSSPMKVVMKTYQEYDWTISATQPIERFVQCAAQIGEAEIDVAQRRVTVRIASSTDIRNVVFQDMKLEAAGSVIKGYEEKDAEGNVSVVPFKFPLELNCNFWRYFIIEQRGVEYRWGINVVMADASLSVGKPNPWARKVELSAEFPGTGDPYFQYKPVSSNEWTDVKDVKVSGTLVTATVTGLEPGTEYQVRLQCGGQTADGGAFLTEEEVQLENLSFDNWTESGNFWVPNVDLDKYIWDTANPGSGKFGIFPTTPETSDVAVKGEGKKAARLESKKAAIVLAAGNIYTGKFGKVDGLGAILDWGVPFNSRPSGLKGYYKYSPKPIDMAKKPYENMKGKSDICQIMIFLTDWDKPFTVNTNRGIFVDLENDPHIIAFGEYNDDQESTEYKEFNLKLEYRDTKRKPKYIVVTACASRYGDSFTGGVGSVLKVDEFKLLYE